METRRLLLAMALSFAVLIGWNLLFPMAQPEPVSEAPAAPGNVAARTQSEPASPLVGPEAEAAPATAEVVMGNDSHDVVIETPLLRANISPVGGVIRTWTLAQFSARAPYPGESPRRLELDTGAGAPMLATLSVVTGQQHLDRALAAAVYEVSAEKRRVAAGETTDVVLRWSDGQGTSIRKSLTFDGSSYTIGVRTTIQTADKRETSLVVGAGISDGTEDGGNGSSVVNAGDKVHRRLADDASLSRLREAAKDTWPPENKSWLATLDEAGATKRFEQVSWCGVEAKYFALLAFGDGPSRALTSPVLSDLRAAPRSIMTALTLPQGESKFRLYIGPKDIDILNKTRPDLAEVVDLGFFPTLARGLQWALRLLYSYIPNYGVGIILLTIAVKLVLLPLSIKQLNTMQRMAALRPQMRAIEEKYSRKLSNPKERIEASGAKNAEVMALYKREGVNPAGGCLPLLLQLPVLYGFYSVLGGAIELRHAPFLLWIQDLSAKDPFYVTPVLMLISMLVQQAITPTTADPVQRRIMFIMPLVFGWIFKDLASGLVLYWLVQNILSIAQQAWMNRLASQREEAEREAKKRGKKKKELEPQEAAAGGGTTA